MSSFYYCNDCKKPVDLIMIDLDGYPILACKECKNWESWQAIIDSPGGYQKIHPGSTHRMGDIEKLNRKE